MREILTTLLVIHLFINIVLCQSEKPIELRSIPLLNRFESSEYKGGIQNWSFDQDSSGILYVANNEGMLEFDGNRWTKYAVPFCTKVRAVLVDKNNRIFVGGQGQIGYYYMTEKGLVFKSLLKLLPEEFQNVSEVWKIIEFNELIYFVTESQMFVYDNIDLKVVNIPGYMRLAFKLGSRFVIQIYGVGMFEMIGNEFIHIEGTKDIPDVVSLVQNDKGEYFYFCRSGEIFEGDPAKSVKQVSMNTNLGSINEAILLSDGVIAVGTQNDGLFLLNSDLNMLQHLSKNEGLSDRTVKSLYEDDCHNLWVALNNGIDYLELSLPLSLINDEVGLEGTGYAACVFNNEAYFGTSNGLFVQQHSKKEFANSYYKLVKGSEGQVYNFSIIDNDLILNHNRGAFQIIDKKLIQFHDIGSWKFVETKHPDVILGGDYQGLSLFKKKYNRWSKIRSIPNFTESSRIFEYENDTTLWMSHGSKGAFRLIVDDEMNIMTDIKHYGEADGFPSNLMISVYSLNGNLIFTSENGIFNFNNASNYFNPNEFFNKWLGTDHVSAIISNGTNTIYYIQDNKFGMISQENFGTYKNETSLFKHINNFINDDLPNISIINDNNVLIGAKEGFIVYNPNKNYFINEDFNVILKTVEIRTTSDSIVKYNPYYIGNKKFQKNQSLSFSYAAPYFDGYHNIKYSYRLLPLENRWSKWSQVGDKEYTFLPSGEYTFEVRAINIYGVESTVKSFSFVVVKPWYFSNFAITGYVFLLLILIAAILTFQKRKYVEENIQISRSSEKALQIKSDEINKISTDSKKEIDRLTHEKLKSEIDLKNDQLTTITLHHMNTNEFIQDVRKKIEGFIDQDGSKQDLRRIIRKIDDNLSDNDSWEQFAYHFDQVHGDYLKKLSKANVRLSPREIKLAAFLRMNMSSKEISSLMNITVRGVELARHRLRKKLKLGRDQNLVEYLIDLDSMD